MDNTKTWWEVHRPSKRKLIQLYSALLYNAHLRGFIEGEIYQGKAKSVCVPGFNCYSCPGAAGACPLGSIQNALACSGHRAGWYVLGIIMIFGLSLGRTICGWLCPLGLIQELLHKIPTPKIPKSRVTRALSYLKYVILAVFVVAIPMWYGIRHDMAIPGFCKYICPAGTFEGAIALLSNPKNSSYFAMLGILFTRKFVIMLVIATACIFCYRSFCRFICPLGAIYGMFNRLALISVKVDESRCIGCGACVRSCKMDVRHTGDHECINCAKCMSVCNKNALSLKCGNYTIIAPDGGCADDKPDSAEKRAKYSSFAWGVAVAVLCFALLWFNVLDPSFKKSSGAGAGQHLPSRNLRARARVSKQARLPDRMRVQARMRMKASKLRRPPGRMPVQEQRRLTDSRLRRSPGKLTGRMHLTGSRQLPEQRLHRRTDRIQVQSSKRLPEQRLRRRTDKMPVQGSKPPRPPRISMRVPPRSAPGSAISWPISLRNCLTAPPSTWRTTAAKSSSSTCGPPTAAPVSRSCRSSRVLLKNMPMMWPCSSSMLPILPKT